VLVIPLAGMIGLIWWPYRRRESDQAGVLFGSAAGRKTAWLAAVVALVTTPALVFLDENYFQKAEWLRSMAPVVGQGLLPFLVLAAAVFGFRLILRKRLAASREDADQAVFVLLATAFAVLTMIAVWFRGEGMALVWPW
jgi:hypothetical protein